MSAQPERIVTQEAVAALQPAPSTELQLRPPAQMSVGDVIAQTLLVQEVMRAVMKEGTHYGKIPSVEKPSLFKPGAEKLCLVFRMDPEYQVESKTEQAEAPWHVGFVMRCTLYHQPTGMRLGSGMGSATTREPKWSEVNEKLKCPTCGKATVIKGKADYGGGWLCFKKQGGCGAKFNDSHTAITSQVVGKVERENVAEVHNTILKMACKRALVAAVLNTTAASDIFTQDLEDLSAALHEEEGGTPAPKKATKADAEWQAQAKTLEAGFEAGEAALKAGAVNEDADPPPGPPLGNISAAQVKRLYAISRAEGVPDDAVKAHLQSMGLASSKDILRSQYDGVIEWIRQAAAGPDEPATSGAKAGERRDH